MILTVPLCKRLPANHGHSVYELPNSDCDWSSQPMRVIEVIVEQRRNASAGKRESPEKTHRLAASSGTIPTCKNSGVALPVIEPDMPILTAHWLFAVTVEGDNWASILQEVTNTVWTNGLHVGVEILCFTSSSGAPWCLCWGPAAGVFLLLEPTGLFFLSPDVEHQGVAQSDLTCCEVQLAVRYFREMRVSLRLSTIVAYVIGSLENGHILTQRTNKIHLIAVPDSDSGAINVIKGKKRERNPDKLKRNVRKRACAGGESYVSARGKNVEAKKQGPVCACKRLCCSKLTDDERDTIYTQFSEIRDKTAQDSYLSGLIQSRKISRRSNRRQDDVEPGEGEYLDDPGTSSATDPKQNKKSYSYLYKANKDCKPHVTYDHYNRLFNTRFNLSFGTPRTDTCKMCDSLKIQLDCCTADNERRVLATKQPEQEQVCFLLTLVNREIVSRIVRHLPERGHSVLLSDQDFSGIEERNKRREVVYAPGYKVFIYDEKYPDEVLVSESHAYVESEMEKYKHLKVPLGKDALQAQHAYDTSIPLNPLKYDDVMKLAQEYVPPVHSPLYENLKRGDDKECGDHDDELSEVRLTTHWGNKQPMNTKLILDITECSVVQHTGRYIAEILLVQRPKGRIGWAEIQRRPAKCWDVVHQSASGDLLPSRRGSPANREHYTAHSSQSDIGLVPRDKRSQSENGYANGDTPLHTCFVYTCTLEQKSRVHCPPLQTELILLFDPATGDEATRALSICCRLQFNDLQARLYSLMYRYADVNYVLVVCCHSGRRLLGQRSPVGVKYRETVYFDDPSTKVSLILVGVYEYDIASPPLVRTNLRPTLRKIVYGSSLDEDLTMNKAQNHVHQSGYPCLNALRPGVHTVGHITQVIIKKESLRSLTLYAPRVKEGRGAMGSIAPHGEGVELWLPSPLPSLLAGRGFLCSRLKGAEYLRIQDWRQSSTPAAHATSLESGNCLVANLPTSSPAIAQSSLTFRLVHPVLRTIMQIPIAHWVLADRMRVYEWACTLLHARSLAQCSIRSLRVQGQEARERYGRQLHARLVSHRSYVQGVQCTGDERPQIELHPPVRLYFRGVDKYAETQWHGGSSQVMPESHSPDKHSTTRQKPQPLPFSMSCRACRGYVIPSCVPISELLRQMLGMCLIGYCMLRNVPPLAGLQACQQANNIPTQFHRCILDYSVLTSAPRSAKSDISRFSLDQSANTYAQYQLTLMQFQVCLFPCPVVKFRAAFRFLMAPNGSSALQEPENSNTGRKHHQHISKKGRHMTSTARGENTEYANTAARSSRKKLTDGTMSSVCDSSFENPCTCYTEYVHSCLTCCRTGGTMSSVCTSSFENPRTCYTEYVHSCLTCCRTGGTMSSVCTSSLENPRTCYTEYVHSCLTCCRTGDTISSVCASSFENPRTCYTEYVHSCLTCCRTGGTMSSVCTSSFENPRTCYTEYVHSCHTCCRTGGTKSSVCASSFENPRGTMSSVCASSFENPCTCYNVYVHSCLTCCRTGGTMSSVCAHSFENPRGTMSSVCASSFENPCTCYNVYVHSCLTCCRTGGTMSSVCAHSFENPRTCYNEYVHSCQTCCRTVGTMSSVCTSSFENPRTCYTDVCAISFENPRTCYTEYVHSCLTCCRTGGTMSSVCTSSFENPCTCYTKYVHSCLTRCKTGDTILSVCASSFENPRTCYTEYVHSCLICCRTGGTMSSVCASSFENPCTCYNVYVHSCLTCCRTCRTISSVCASSFENPRTCYTEHVHSCQTCCRTGGTMSSVCASSFENTRTCYTEYVHSCLICCRTGGTISSVCASSFENSRGTISSVCASSFENPRTCYTEYVHSCLTCCRTCSTMSSVCASSFENPRTCYTEYVQSCLTCCRTGGTISSVCASSFENPQHVAQCPVSVLVHLRTHVRVTMSMFCRVRHFAEQEAPYPVSALVHLRTHVRVTPSMFTRVRRVAEQVAPCPVSALVLLRTHVRVKPSKFTRVRHVAEQVAPCPVSTLVHLRTHVRVTPSMLHSCQTCCRTGGTISSVCTSSFENPRTCYTEYVQSCQTCCRTAGTISSVCASSFENPRGTMSSVCASSFENLRTCYNEYVHSCQTCCRTVGTMSSVCAISFENPQLVAPCPVSVLVHLRTHVLVTPSMFTCVRHVAEQVAPCPVSALVYLRTHLRVTPSMFTRVRHVAEQVAPCPVSALVHLRIHVRVTPSMFTRFLTCCRTCRTMFSACASSFENPRTCYTDHVHSCQTCCRIGGTISSVCASLFENPCTCYTEHVHSCQTCCRTVGTMSSVCASSFENPRTTCGTMPSVCASSFENPRTCYTEYVHSCLTCSRIGGTMSSVCASSFENPRTCYTEYVHSFLTCCRTGGTISSVCASSFENPRTCYTEYVHSCLTCCRTCSTMSSVCASSFENPRTCYTEYVQSCLTCCRTGGTISSVCASSFENPQHVAQCPVSVLVHLRTHVRVTMSMFCRVRHVAEQEAPYPVSALVHLRTHVRVTPSMFTRVRRVAEQLAPCPVSVLVHLRTHVRDTPSMFTRVRRVAEHVAPYPVSVLVHLRTHLRVTPSMFTRVRRVAEHVAPCPVSALVHLRTHVRVTPSMFTRVRHVAEQVAPCPVSALVHLRTHVCVTPSMFTRVRHVAEQDTRWQHGLCRQRPASQHRSIVKTRLPSSLAGRVRRDETRRVVSLY
ncbi:hypothetical protein PR048_018827 [Dryococelus australis]|uniref:Uncharacterized protein n=1 Tax=Dryococelus australis TaxID=614101 RepID=A0ABQ9H1R7_9NEOP|nr:hypothetical protein PR048_018827 [Dryococelus australis]